jgi:hypothetical protein
MTLAVTPDTRRVATYERVSFGRFMVSVEIRRASSGAAVESAAGRHPEAVRMLGAVLALTEASGAAAPQLLGIQRRVEDAASHGIGSEMVKAGLAEGRRMTPGGRGGIREAPRRLAA